MGQNLNFSQIPPLSEAEINQNKYKLSELWMIHHDKMIFGPYHLDLVKTIAHEHTKTLESSSACNLESGQWLFFFDHGVFQNRSATQTLYRPVNITDEKIIVYADEKEHGPYSLSELTHLFNKNHFRSVDLFSIDNGDSWRKIYEIEGLDRRKKDLSQLRLPDIPDVSAYTKEQLKHMEQASNKHNVVIELKKITPENLAHRHKKKRSHQRPRPSQSRIHRREAKQDSRQSSSLGKWFLILLLLGLWLLKDKILTIINPSSQSATTRSFKRKVTRLNQKKKQAPKVKKLATTAPSLSDSSPHKPVESPPAQYDYIPPLEGEDPPPPQIGEMRDIEILNSDSPQRETFDESIDYLEAEAYIPETGDFPSLEAEAPMEIEHHEIYPPTDLENMPPPVSEQELMPFSNDLEEP